MDFDEQDSYLSEKSALELTNAKKQGYLHKDGGKGIKKNWKRRWFILQDSYLYYFVDDGANKPKGVIKLIDYEKTEISDDVAGKFCFKIIPKETSPRQNPKTKKIETRRIYTIFALKESEREEWITAIDETLKALLEIQRYRFASRARLESTCFIKVSEARFHDQTEKDTYCTILADNLQKIRTPTTWKSSKPVFDQEYDFDLPTEPSSVCVQIRDAKKKENNIIGQTVIKCEALQDQQVHDQWFKIHEHQPYCGDIKISYQVKGGRLQVFLHEARNLRSSNPNDPRYFHAVFKFLDQKIKTAEVKNNPVWQYDNVLDLPTNDEIGKDLSKEFTITIWRGEVESGQCVFKLDGFIGWEGEEKWFPLKEIREAPEIGELHLSIHKQEAIILKDAVYDDLVQLLINRMTIIDKLISVSSKKEKPIAECLVKAFEMRRSAVLYLRYVTKSEIESTNSVGIIFRGNSVATKSVDMYMRLMGLPYLHYVMKPIFSLIMSNSKDKKKSCELDPTRIEAKEERKGKVIARNLQNLTNYVQMIFDAIFKTLDLFPSNFRSIFEHLKSNVNTKFLELHSQNPEEQQQLKLASHRAVGGFVFLRFFCPSLLSPKSFGLSTEHPPRNVARDLTLIAKCLQNLANLVEFGKKEPFMIPCNAFLQEMMEPMKNLLEKMCTLPDGAIDELPVKVQINWGREIARVHFHLVDNLEAIQQKFPPENPEHEDLRELQKVLADLDNKVSQEKSSLIKKTASGSVSSKSSWHTPSKTRGKLGTKSMSSNPGTKRNSRSPDLLPFLITDNVDVSAFTSSLPNFPPKRLSQVEVSHMEPLKSSQNDFSIGYAKSMNLPKTEDN